MEWKEAIKMWLDNDCKGKIRCLGKIDITPFSYSLFDGCDYIAPGPDWIYYSDPLASSFIIEHVKAGRTVYYRYAGVEHVDDEWIKVKDWYTLHTLCRLDNGEHVFRVQLEE